MITIFYVLAGVPAQARAFLRKAVLSPRFRKRTLPNCKQCSTKSSSSSRGLLTKASTDSKVAPAFSRAEHSSRSADWSVYKDRFHPPVARLCQQQTRCLFYPNFAHCLISVREDCPKVLSYFEGLSPPHQRAESEGPAGPPYHSYLARKTRPGVGFYPKAISDRWR